MESTIKYKVITTPQNENDNIVEYKVCFSALKQVTIEDYIDGLRLIQMKVPKSCTINDVLFQIKQDAQLRSLCSGYNYYTFH